ncbi:MAG: hypothetical protein WAU99_15365, partial [Pseudolabrys sp.]
DILHPLAVRDINEIEWGGPDKILLAGLPPNVDCTIVFDGNNGRDFASDHFGLFCRLEFLPSTLRVG